MTQKSLETELRKRAKPLLAEPEGDWLCLWCHNRVANERDRFRYQGKDEFAFTNPDGVHFQIITFSCILGCVRTGTPTLQHTWFPDHSWSYCQCDQCGQHLGWFYSGENTFIALIKSRIVRALLTRN
ncbi:MAG TPA: cereblon family protein [Clostridia bacterium]|nr:cereblon family protein [Clostridia bacterium]